jgi:vancomycin resistance protein VanK
MRDLPLFIALHDETHKRHGFTPYTNSFFKAQLEKFAAQKQATLYLARYNGEVIAASIHMHFGGETSYHHGASTHKYSKIPASYLLQWTAITDALRRGDHVYNFWGIAPVKEGTDQKTEIQKKHPFAGVTLFKMGYGGKLLNLTHCMDIPLSSKYYLTRAFEYVRKWKRGF